MDENNPQNVQQPVVQDQPTVPVSQNDSYETPPVKKRSVRLELIIPLALTLGIGLSVLVYLNGGNLDDISTNSERSSTSIQSGSTESSFESDMSQMNSDLFKWIPLMLGILAFSSLVSVAVLLNISASLSSINSRLDNDNQIRQ